MDSERGSAHDAQGKGGRLKGTGMSWLHNLLSSLIAFLLAVVLAHFGAHGASGDASGGALGDGRNAPAPHSDASAAPARDSASR